MRSLLLQPCCIVFLLAIAGTAAAAGSYMEVGYPASAQPGELQLGVTYMLEGRLEAFSGRDLRDACLLFVNSARADGAGVDCVKFDGTPIYKPGFGTMGENPVADGGPFTVNVAWHTHRRLQDKQLVVQIVDRLVKAMTVVPQDPQTGMVYIKPEGYDRRPFGFTDTVRKQGDELLGTCVAGFHCLAGGFAGRAACRRLTVPASSRSPIWSSAP